MFDQWNAFSQTVYNFTGSIAAVGTVGAAVYAAFLYRSNSRLERARWASSLYEKFYEREQLKQVRETLDCQSDLGQVQELVEKELPPVTDYLNFFEFVAFLESRKQLQREEVEDLFGYYIGCLNRHKIVRAYVEQNGYERLTKLLESSV